MSDDRTLVPSAGTDGPSPPLVVLPRQYLLFSGQSQHAKGEVLALLKHHKWRMHQAGTLDDLEHDRRVPWQSN